jgi:hypothetical protein
MAIKEIREIEPNQKEIKPEEDEEVLIDENEPDSEFHEEQEEFEEEKSFIGTALVPEEIEDEWQSASLEETLGSEPSLVQETVEQRGGDFYQQAGGGDFYGESSSGGDLYQQAGSGDMYSQVGGESFYAMGETDEEIGEIRSPNRSKLEIEGSNTFSRGLNKRDVKTDITKYSA